MECSYLALSQTVYTYKQEETDSVLSGDYVGVTHSPVSPKFDEKEKASNTRLSVFIFLNVL